MAKYAKAICRGILYGVIGGCIVKEWWWVVVVLFIVALYDVWAIEG